MISNKLKTSLVCLLFLFYFISFFSSPARAVDGEIIYTGINTNMVGDDGVPAGTAGPYNLGFTFNFYGSNYTQAYFNINGTLNFTSAYTAYSNGSLASAGQNDSLYPFWDDLITDPSPYDVKPIYYATIGEAPNRKFVGQWTNVYFYGTSIQMGTFMVILYEGSNEIQFQYRDLLGGDRALGNSATIGIKKDASNYKQYSSDTASLVQGQAIRYTPDGLGGYTVQSSTPGVGEQVGELYDLVYLAPEGSPASPNLVNPTDGTTGITTTPTFEWLPVEGATSYTVLISTVSNFSSTVVNQSGITGTSYTHGSALNNSTNYYWRVQAVNSYGSSLSATRTFTTGSANANPDTPSSVSSATLIGGTELESLAGSTLTATLSDPDDDEQVRYRLQIASNDTFTSLLIDYRSPFGAEGVFNYSFGEDEGTYLVGASDTNLDPGNYYLRLRAEDQAAGSSSWYTASGIAFTVSSDETGPVLTELAAAAGSTSATISWQSNELASSQVEYGLLPTYGEQTAELNTAPRVSSHSIELTDLQACARYFYRVKSADAADNLTTSSQQTFQTSGCLVSEIVAGSEDLVSTSGGSVEFSSGRASAALVLPENFYTGEVRIQLNQLDATTLPSPPSSFNLVNNSFFDLLAVDENDELVSEFAQAVTFVVSYDEETEASFVESSLDVYRYSEGTWTKLNCDLDTAANTLTCALPSFSVYAVFGEGASAQPSPQAPVASSSEQTSVTGAASCTAEQPASAPEIYQIDATLTTATLYFVPSSGRVDGYVIEYGFANDVYEHAVSFVHADQSGAVRYTIEQLLPAQSWQFRVQAFHGCAYGAWSASRVVSTGKSAGMVGSQSSAIKPAVEAELETEAQLAPSSAPAGTPAQVPAEVPEPTRYRFEIPAELRERWQQLIPDLVSYLQTSAQRLVQHSSTTWSNLRSGLYDQLQPVQTSLSESSSALATNLAATMDIWLDTHPTTITGLQVAEAGSDYAVITWETNHYATSKVSYGDSHDYGQDVQDVKKVKHHQIKIDGLQPDTIYYYEVMSQGKTYAYDARHEFRTK